MLRGVGLDRVTNPTRSISTCAHHRVTNGGVEVQPMQLLHVAFQPVKIRLHALLGLRQQNYTEFLGFPKK